MRDSASPSALPDTLAARLAALRTAAAPALLPGPTRDSSDELAARLARLHTPSKRDVERRVPIETKGVELAADKTRDDEVERFLREVEAEQTTANAAGVDDDADKLIRSILSSSSAPSDSRAPRIPSPPASPPLARARQSIPALSPSLLDTLSGVEVQFFRPALAGTTAVPDGHDYGYEDEEHELLRRAGDEAKLEARLLHGDDDGAGAWEARLAGLRQSVGYSLPSSTGGGGVVGRGTAAAAPLGHAPESAGVEEMRRALRRRERQRARRGGEEVSSSEEGESSDSGDETASEASSSEDCEDGEG